MAQLRNHAWDILAPIRSRPLSASSPHNDSRSDSPSTPQLLRFAPTQWTASLRELRLGCSAFRSAPSHPSIPTLAATAREDSCRNTSLAGGRQIDPCKLREIPSSKNSPENPSWLNGKFCEEKRKRLLALIFAQAGACRLNYSAFRSHERTSINVKLLTSMAFLSDLSMVVFVASFVYNLGAPVLLESRNHLISSLSASRYVTLPAASPEGARGVAAELGRLGMMFGRSRWMPSASSRCAWPPPPSTFSTTRFA